MEPEPTNKQKVEIPAHNLVQMDSIHLGEAIKNDFGINLKSIEKIEQGFQNQVYKAITDEGKTVFVRINKKSKVFETEIWGHEILQQKGIPVPDVIAYQKNPATIGHPTMIISAVRGVSITEAKLSPREEESAYKNMGEVLKKINETKMEGFGPIEMVDGKFEGRYKNYKDYCEWRETGIREAIEFLLNNNLITQEDTEKLYKIIKEINSLDIKQSYLQHRDIHEGHVFVDQGKITGIIDLGRLSAGDPRHDIGISLIFQDDRQQNYFKEGYGQQAKDPMVLKYLAISATTKAMFRIKGNRNISAERSLQLLKQILEKI